MNWAANGRLLDVAFIALLLAASLLFPLGTLSRSLATSDKSAVAVIFAPWVSADSAMQRVAAAGARIVRFGALPFIVIAEPEAVDFGARVTSAGAVFMLDPLAVAGCTEPEGAK